MTPEDALTPEGFEVLQRETLEKEINVWPARAWYLFDAAHPCDRYKVWRWTLSEAQKPHGYQLQSIFGEGRIHQPAVYARLEALGFEVVRESDRPRQWKLKGGAVISGRVDGKIVAWRGKKYDPKRLLEIKSASGWSYDKINRVEDLQHADEHYLRGYYDQWQLGAILEELEHGVIVMKSKQTGLCKAMPVILDYAHAEGLLKRIERLDAMVKAKIDPPPITYDARICGDCGFNHLCWPPRDSGEGAVLLDDVTLLEDIERRQTLEADHKEYDALDKSVKARIKKAVSVGQIALLGGYQIEIKEVEKTATKPDPTVPKRVEQHVHITKLDAGR